MDFFDFLSFILIQIGLGWASIAIKSFIEGIAFVLTLQDSYSAGMAFLVAMLFKLFPLEPGYAIILSDAGLNHFWENLLSTLAVLPIYIGKIFLSLSVLGRICCDSTEYP